MDARHLVGGIQQATASTAGWWQGTVNAVNTGPPKTLTVLIDGNTMPTVCRYSDGIATPAIGDVLWGYRDAQGDHIAIYRLA
jgi:hypothetical protein